MNEILELLRAVVSFADDAALMLRQGGNPEASDEAARLGERARAVIAKAEAERVQ